MSGSRITALSEWSPNGNGSVLLSALGQNGVERLIMLYSGYILIFEPRDLNHYLSDIFHINEKPAHIGL